MNPETNPYRSPNETAPEPPPEPEPSRAGKLAFTLGAVFLLIVCSIFGLINNDLDRSATPAAPDAYNIGATLGTLTAPLIMAAIVMGLFAIRKKNRNYRKMVRVAFWTLLILTVGQCNSFVQKTNRMESRTKEKSTLKPPPDQHVSRLDHSYQVTFRASRPARTVSTSTQSTAISSGKPFGPAKARASSSRPSIRVSASSWPCAWT